MTVDWASLAAIAYLAVLAYTFARTLENTGSITRSIIAVSVMADLGAAALLVLGVDRPLFLLCTRLGCITVTALTLFLAAKIPTTIYLILNRERLEKLLDQERRQALQ